MTSVELPDEVLAFLVRAAPAREVWKWLSQEENFALSHTLTRGFQRTANALRQPIVRGRMVSHLKSEPGDFQTFLKLWSDAEPPPPVVREVRERLEAGTLAESLPTLWQRHGGEALTVALVREDQAHLLETFEPDAALSEDAPPTLEAETLVPEEAAGTAPAPKTAPAASGIALPTTGTMPAANDEGESSGGTDEVLAALRAEAAQWRRRAEVAEAQLLAATQKSRDELNRAAQEAARQIRVESKRWEVEHARLEEEKRLHDRVGRKLKHAEKDVEELSVENKRLKRQLRQGQQLSEELRRELAGQKSLLEEAQGALEEATRARSKRGWKSPTLREASHGEAPPHQPPAHQPPARGKSWTTPSVAEPTLPTSPLDQTFVWVSDGRTFRFSPRDVKRAVDRNDERAVNGLIQALDALRASNPNGHALFWKHIGELGRYYRRVLSGATTRVLVDASNVARQEKDRRGKGQLQSLLAMRDELRRRDCFPIIIYADASLPFNIDRPDELAAMEKRDEIILTHSGQEADELLAREARRTGAYVVTNDRNFHLKVSPDFEPPRVTFRVLDGHVIVDDF